MKQIGRIKDCNSDSDGQAETVPRMPVSALSGSKTTTGVNK
jgi:hypothetical protein